ncbi:transcriptional regulatory protein (plasmid) [Aromatoleum aromaticum EbN1]|uniref:Transcriptional regulatory protein n=1 Tax=Aromatoleum aromaticum (strain DSM 19018 / LMG 30748 / EbN1) TaxID=76114 RepID=Q5NW65_AROAE|nr:GntR family transcriptional regulator [Aromatoleum aromaticum]CAI10699.1 transcriptional regulatory protein [Aromatoleum aromaticum EbN1]
MRKTTKVTHAEMVRMAIEQDIFSGRLPPGSPIDEDALSERFSVSRTPIREAMLQLIESGLVEKSARQRATVARLNVRRLLQSFEALSEVEGMCARLATRRMTQSERDALVENYELGAKALAAADKEEFFRLGRRFHAIVIGATHNDVLIELTNKLVLPLVPYRRFQLGRGERQDQTQVEHGAIVAAIQNGNADEAYELMRRHNTVQGDALAEYVSMDSEVVA